MSTPHVVPIDLPRLPPRRPESNKIDFGRLLLIGGSQGMAGAIALAGMAALRSGAGLVKLATAKDCQPTVATFEPAAMTIPLPSDAHGRIARSAREQIAEAAAEATVVACGPGLGRSAELVELITWIYQDLTQSVVADADALFALSRNTAVLPKHAGPRILTPHEGEFARLTGRKKIETADRERLAREFAQENGAIVVLKGHCTVVTDGRQCSINSTGNPGMATGGTGDVLTGIITAIVGQGLAVYDAARLGVYVHGLAGDIAAEELGQISLTAHDLITYLPLAWKFVCKR